MNITDEILELKEKIEDIKSERDQLKGRKNAAEERLKEEFGFDDVKEAEKYLDSCEKELEKMKKDIQEGLEDIKSKFDWS
jgi:chromosome segregation ATPase